VGYSKIISEPQLNLAGYSNQLQCKASFLIRDRSWNTFVPAAIELINKNSRRLDFLLCMALYVF